MLGRQGRDEPGHGFEPVLDHQDTAGGIGVEKILGRIQKSHALTGGFAHPQFVGHQFQAHQRAYPREQGGIVHRFGEKIVGARLQPGDAIGGLVQRRHHHHRNMGDPGIGLDAAADLEAVHAGHHHVQQHNVGNALRHAGQAFQPVEGGDDIEIFRRQLRFQKLDVGHDVIDDEDACGHEIGAPTRYPMKRRTVSRKLVTEIGLEI